MNTTLYDTRGRKRPFCLRVKINHNENIKGKFESEILFFILKKSLKLITRKSCINKCFYKTKKNLHVTAR